MDLSAILPPHEGLLPKWLMVVWIELHCPSAPLLVLTLGLTRCTHQISLVSALNSIQAFATLHYTKRVYSGDPAAVTSLSGRTFGTWTFLSSVVRFYAAYKIDDPQMYQLALWTYVIAAFHFVSEWRYFRTANWEAGLAFPVIIAIGSLSWMLAQWSFYVHQ